ncbi:MAG: chemotaxis response regulator protein-glutamate methylesterase [Desulforhabdus sp.]|nr:chemotaxis response regulator protein-glutamate methylesterase [Desulforhabdus sp.]
MAIKVLIIDDSPLMRLLLKEILGEARDIEVVGTAPNPLAAREMIKSLKPDVLTLDVEMPQMGGLEFLRRLMHLRPMPVVMVSSHTAEGSAVTLQALELGAVDFITKPVAGSPTVLRQYGEEICEKVRAAGSARIRSRVSEVSRPSSHAGAGARLDAGGRMRTEGVIAIGASTGGTEAIREILQALPAEIPPVVMVQHMPETFTASFAQRLDGLSALTVAEVRDGQRLCSGHAYLAPGHSHFSVRRTGSGYVAELARSAPVNRHRPSVDVLFQSVSQHYRQNALGIILTGMGRDGAQGLLAMHQAGAWTLGQDQQSCVVYGMPRAAAELGALDEVAPLSDIAIRILSRLRQS